VEDRKMYEMMDPQALRQRRGEMLRDAERGRQAGALPTDRKRRRDLRPVWELERVAGRLLKPLRRSREILMFKQGTSCGMERARRKKDG
jgi:hypothetical protein